MTLDISSVSTALGLTVDNAFAVHNYMSQAVMLAKGVSVRTFNHRTQWEAASLDIGRMKTRQNQFHITDTPAKLSSRIGSTQEYGVDFIIPDSELTAYAMDSAAWVYTIVKQLERTASAALETIVYQAALGNTSVKNMNGAYVPTDVATDIGSGRMLDFSTAGFTIDNFRELLGVAGTSNRGKSLFIMAPIKDALELRHTINSVYSQPPVLMHNEFMKVYQGTTPFGNDLYIVSPDESVGGQEFPWEIVGGKRRAVAFFANAIELGFCLSSTVTHRPGANTMTFGGGDSQAFIKGKVVVNPETMPGGILGSATIIGGGLRVEPEGVFIIDLAV